MDIIFKFSSGIIILFFLYSCSVPKARKPVSYGTGFDQSESIIFNKKLYSNESDVIKNYIKNDTLHQYIDSKHGFWYAFINEVKNDTIFPVKGNKAVIQYLIADFNENEIYSENEIGIQKYRVDQEVIIQGLREGIKWMNKGEKVKFLLPSHKAYAYHGDENKIGPNTPIIVTLKLINIED
jgi:gliding motility-associated peptidyl-prolyl isomerase